MRHRHNNRHPTILPTAHCGLEIFCYLCRMTEDLENIERLLRDSRAAEAVERLEAYLATPGASCLDVAYYLLGNAYRQKSDWRKAINNYNRAVQLNPDGPAKTALQTANEILDYFNHDLYNP